MVITTELEDSDAAIRCVVLKLVKKIIQLCRVLLNPLNAELNPICHLLALLGAHHILHISRIGVKM